MIQEITAMLDQLGMANSAIEKELGLANGVLYKIRNGKLKSIPEEAFQKLKDFHAKQISIEKKQENAKIQQSVTELFSQQATEKPQDDTNGTQDGPENPKETQTITQPEPKLKPQFRFNYADLINYCEKKIIDPAELITAHKNLKSIKEKAQKLEEKVGPAEKAKSKEMVEPPIGTNAYFLRYGHWGVEPSKPQAQRILK